MASPVLGSEDAWEVCAAPGEPVPSEAGRMSNSRVAVPAKWVLVCPVVAVTR